MHTHKGEMILRIAVAASDDAAAEVLTKALQRAFPQGAVAVFHEIEALLSDVHTHATDMVLMDSTLCEQDREKVTKQLKTCNPNIDIIFVRGMYESSAAAFAAKEWILLPASCAQAQHEHAPPKINEQPHILLYVQCFGNFEVFQADRSRLHFKRKKSKELFAYLVYRRGAACSNAEIASILFEDDDYSLKRQQYLQKIIAFMTETLAQAQAESVIIRNRGNISVDITRIQCDYYRFIEHDSDAARAWSGEFMTQYSWAEPTAGYIAETMEKEN